MQINNLLELDQEYANIKDKVKVRNFKKKYND
jgi:hypothetical protein